MTKKDFDKIYDAFFTKRSQVISSGKQDLELLDFVLEKMGFSTTKDNSKLLEKLVLEFSKRKLPLKKFSRHNLLNVDSLVSNGNLIEPEPIQVKIKPLNSSFDDILKSLSRIVAKDNLRPIMESVYLNSKAKELVATDTFNLVVKPFKLTGKSIIIDPKTNLKNVDENAQLYKSKYEIISGTFPDYKRVIPKYSNHSKSFDLLAFLSNVKAIEKLSCFFSEPSRFVVKLLAKSQVIYLKPTILSKLLTAMAELGVESFQFTWDDEKATYKPVLLKADKNVKSTFITMPFLIDEGDSDYALMEFDLNAKLTKANIKKDRQSKPKIPLRKKPKNKVLSLKAKAIKLKLQLLKL
jgi:hypothetical protein